MEDSVAMYFDPICPWTWISSRWLVRAGEGRGFPVLWRPMSLSILNEGSIPKDFAEPLSVSAKTLRVIATLENQGRNDDIGRLYELLGTRWHTKGNAPDLAFVSQAISSLDLGDVAGALDDESLDALVRSSHDRAIGYSGPSTGSPVVVFDGSFGVHGPILTQMLSDEEAVELYDHVRALAIFPKFSELKRGRTQPPIHHL